MSVGDDYFGPQVRGYFDFTILFEQSILSILPSALFILLVPVRISSLLRNGIRVRSGRLLWLKLVLITHACWPNSEARILMGSQLAVTAFLCLQIALITLWSLPTAPKTKTSVAESAIGLIETIAIGALSYTEHKRSVRPSLLLGAYLVLTIILDTAHARTLWIRDGLTPIAGVFTASLAIKAVILVLEETPKRAYLPDSEKDIAVECTTGVVSRSLFWWLNGLFFQGFRLLIGLEDLGSIDPKFDSTVLLDRLDRVWSRGKSDTCFSAVHGRGREGNPS